MKIELSAIEAGIAIKALRNRTEDLTRFANEAERQGMRTAMCEFLEMANDNDAVLDKIENALDALNRES